MPDDAGGGDPPTAPFARSGVGFLAPGTRVRDYVVEGVLSRGGFGTVYRVQHAVLGRPAAMKVLHADLVASEDARLRFEREAQATNRINHPNIVDVHDFGTLPDGRLFFVMELLSGTDLASYLAAHGRMSPDEVLSIFEPLCSALAVAHQKGIVHRDLKASNVFLTDKASGQRVVLLDFGVAKLLAQGAVDITTVHHLVGTPACMSPEQITSGPVDARTDVYALGALAFHLLTGEPAFTAESVTNLHYLHLHAPRPRPSRQANVAPAVDAVILRAMSVDPAARHPGAPEFFQALREAVAGARATGPDPSQVECRPGLAVYADVRPERAALEPPEPALLSDMMSILPDVSAALTRAGFAVAMQTGTSMLLVRLLGAGGDARREARSEAVQAILELWRHLERRPGRDPRLHLSLWVHADEVLLVHGKMEGGQLLRFPAWVPEADVDGAFASLEVLADLGLESEPLAGTAMRRL